MNEIQPVKTLKTPIAKTSALHSYADFFVTYIFEKNTVLRFVPEGIYEILFQVRGDFASKYETQDWKNRPTGFIGGLHTQAYHVQAENNRSVCIGIQLRPQMARYLLPEPLKYFKNKMVGLEDIWGKYAKKLIDQIGQEADQNRQFDLMERFFSDRIQNIKPKLDAGIQDTIASNCAVRVSELADSVYKSDSHFRKLFLEEVGISPKEYLKVMRVKKAIAALKANDHSNLTSLSYELGYYDQAHFIKEFTSITRTPPRKFMLQQHI